MAELPPTRRTGSIRHRDATPSSVADERHRLASVLARLMDKIDYAAVSPGRRDVRLDAPSWYLMRREEGVPIVAAVHDPGGALVQDMRRSTGKAHVVRVNRSHVDKQGQRRHAGCSAGPRQNGTHQMYKSSKALRRKNFKCIVPARRFADNRI
jgi:hypothetical protein